MIAHRTAHGSVSIQRISAIVVAALALGYSLFAGSVAAEEGGSGHYLPGSMASFIDGVPAKPTFLARLNYVYYDGDAKISREVPIAGLLAGGLEATSNAVGLTLVWAPDVDLGDKIQYAMSSTIPLVSIEVSAEVREPAGGVAVHRSDEKTGLGDIVVIPLMLDYEVNPDLNINGRVSLYAPTGDYEVGRLANTGKNFWTFEPTLAVNYFGKDNGIEGSLFFGMDFNTKNQKTEYKSGTQLHLDGTVAQHFPLWGGAAGVGASGFLYRQVTADGGAGATLGGFKAQANGIGPVISYIRNVAGHDILGEFKWLREIDNKRRLEGDTLWLKVIAKF